MAPRGAAGVEVTQEVLSAHDAVLPLVPYLDTLRWVFIAAALAGVAVTVYDEDHRGADYRGGNLELMHFSPETTILSGAGTQAPSFGSSQAVLSTSPQPMLSYQAQACQAGSAGS